jgi:sodium-dependent dicarboxylate transporter 2/3/5
VVARHRVPARALQLSAVDEELDPTVPGARFDALKQRVGLIAGPVLALGAGLAATDGPAPGLVGLMVLCVTWWITEALPAAVVALAAACGAVLLGLATPKVAFAAFGTPLLFLFVGSFFVAEAMRLHGLGERTARAMASLARGRLSLLVVVGLTTFFLSMIMSNAAATAIVLPMALSMARADARFAAALVLAVAWGASIGGLGTPVGTPPNLIGIAALREYGVELGFAQWMAVGVPLGLVMFVGLIAVLALGFAIRPGQPLPELAASSDRAWSAGERSVVVAIILALVGWLAPSVAGLLAPDAAVTRWMASHLSEEVVALLSGGSLFLLPGGRPGAARPALLWSEATRIEWGVILLFGGGILLGDLARTTGLADQWGRALVSATGASTTWTITALVTGIAIVLSEATSNTATATLMAPLAGAIAQSAGAAPIPAVLGATIGASFGFMMPISTAPNALAYATGRVRIGQMIRHGIVFDLIGYVLIVAGLRVLCPLMGWT